LWTFLTRKPKGIGKPREERSKIKEVREMGAPSSYLTGLLHKDVMVQPEIIFI
jgi:hypothetical protein